MKDSHTLQMEKILIVEDEQRIAKFIEKGFRINGFSTRVVSDGEQALEATQTDTYDVILLDLMLPIKDGWAVLKELRGQGDEVPVIVVTAVDTPLQKARASGASDCIVKPFRFKELLDAVYRQIDSAMTDNL